MSTTPQASNSGIVTDDKGERFIPASTRADGSTRKAVKIRPGYRPPEDVEVYKNRTAEAFRGRGKGSIPGAEGLKEDKSAADQSPAGSAASNKNAKRREARKRAKAAAEAQDEDRTGDAEEGATAGANADLKITPAVPSAENGEATVAVPPAADAADPEVEKKKKIRNLKKKLEQARSLREKKEGGESLLPEQIAKVIKINELIRELEALGFDTGGGEDEAQKNDGEKPESGAS